MKVNSLIWYALESGSKVMVDIPYRNIKPGILTANSLTVHMNKHRWEALITVLHIIICMYIEYIDNDRCLSKCR